MRALGFHTIAVTGSFARGDAGPGSDIDLWVIGARDQRFEWVVGGVPVTVMVETKKKATSLEHLKFVEVDHAQVVSDPLRIFARVKQTFAKNRAALYRGIRAQTVRDIAFHLQRSLNGDPAHRVLSLRRAVHRAICLEAFDQLGLRDPRRRHLEQVFDKRELRSIDTMMGWRLSPAAAAALLRALASVEPVMTPFIEVREGYTPTFAALDGALHKLRTGDIAEGIEKTRFWLDGLAALVEGGDEPWNVLLPVFPDEAVRAYRLAHALEGASAAKLRPLVVRWLASRVKRLRLGAGVARAVEAVRRAKL